MLVLPPFSFIRIFDLPRVGRLAVALTIFSGLSACGGGEDIVAIPAPPPQPAPVLEISLLAGGGRSGITNNDDGVGVDVVFGTIVAMSRVDEVGNFLVYDRSATIPMTNPRIRRVTPDGTVMTQPPPPNPNNLPFIVPSSDTRSDSAGNTYVADATNHVITRTPSGGVASIFAGTSGIAGYADGVGQAARFNSPRGLDVDNAGNVYVADTGNTAIRKISPNGVVSTVAGQPGTDDLLQTGPVPGKVGAVRFIAVDRNTGVIYFFHTRIERLLLKIGLR